MSEPFTRSQVEAALTEDGYSVLQEMKGGLTIYGTNMYPGNELLLDWSRGEYEWGDLRKHLEFNGIDPKPIYERLSKMK